METRQRVYIKEGGEIPGYSNIRTPVSMQLTQNEIDVLRNKGFTIEIRSLNAREEAITRLNAGIPPEKKPAEKEISLTEEKNKTVDDEDEIKAENKTTNGLTEEEDKTAEEEDETAEEEDETAEEEDKEKTKVTKRNEKKPQLSGFGKRK
jgi:phage terminase small subunit